MAVKEKLSKVETEGNPEVNETITESNEAEAGTTESQVEEVKQPQQPQRVDRRALFAKALQQERKVEDAQREFASTGDLKKAPAFTQTVMERELPKVREAFEKIFEIELALDIATRELEEEITNLETMGRNKAYEHELRQEAWQAIKEAREELVQLQQPFYEQLRQQHELLFPALRTLRKAGWNHQIGVQGDLALPDEVNQRIEREMTEARKALAEARKAINFFDVELKKSGIEGPNLDQTRDYLSGAESSLQDYSWIWARSSAEKNLAWLSRATKSLENLVKVRQRLASVGLSAKEDLGHAEELFAKACELFRNGKFAKGGVKDVAEQAHEEISRVTEDRRDSRKGAQHDAREARRQADKEAARQNKKNKGGNSGKDKRH